LRNWKKLLGFTFFFWGGGLVKFSVQRSDTELRPRKTYTILLTTTPLSRDNWWIKGAEVPSGVHGRSPGTGLHGRRSTRHYIEAEMLRRKLSTFGEATNLQLL